VIPGLIDAHVHLYSVPGAAAPGEVLVSSTVNDLVTGSDREFESRGRHRLKGIEREWELYAAVCS
jgi:class 3 adenylate cyclase